MRKQTTRRLKIVHAAKIHADAHWKHVRVTTAHITDPRNTLKMKRRRKGAFSHCLGQHICEMDGGGVLVETHHHCGSDERNSLLETADDLVQANFAKT